VRSIIFHPKAQQAIRRFPKDVRVRLGKGLFRLQMGELIGMPDSRPMRGVLVFHAFVKKTQRTPPLEIERAKKRLKELFDA